MTYLARLRETEKNLERATHPSVESVETPRKGTLDTFDTTPPALSRISRGGNPAPAPWWGPSSSLPCACG